MDTKPTKEKISFFNKLNVWVENHLSPVPFVHKILFVYNLYIMIKAGLSIVAALKILSEQVENKHLKKVIGEIKTKVEKGRQLSEVLAEYPKIFPPIYVNMIAAGEAAGKMEQSLEQVSNQMKKSHELSSRIRGAMIYPAVIIIAMLGIGIEMVVFVLPKLIGMFKDFKAELPLATRMLMAIVNFMQNYGLWVAISTILLISLSIWLIRKPKIKRLVHQMNLHLPIAGPIIKKINLARFTMTLASLLQSAIPIIEAIKIAASVQTNVIYREALLRAAESLKKGDTLSSILTLDSKIFPAMVTQMVMVGEESGQVENMLKELSNYYGNEVDNTMRNFSTVIEPVIILLLGLGTAGIAVAVIMPIYSLAQSF